MKGLPVTLSSPELKDIDLDITYESVRRQIDKVVAGAYFLGMNYVGQLQDLQNAQGRLVFLFGKDERVFLKRRFFWVNATINTETRTMDLSIEDVTKTSPSRHKEVFIGNEAFRGIADRAYFHINQLGLSNTIVALEQVQAGRWRITCGPFGTFKKDCEFYIVDGEIRDTGT